MDKCSNKIKTRYLIFVGDFCYDETDFKECTERLLSIDIIRRRRSYDDQKPRYALAEHAYLQEKDCFLEIGANKLRKIKDLIWEIHATV